jgi:hypothetical protein
MQFMAVFNWGPEGGGTNVPARWAHGPTPGINVITSWVSAGSWGTTDEGPNTGRTWVVFEAENVNQVLAYTSYMEFVCDSIELWPVFEYTPHMKAYEAGDPGQWPGLATMTDEQKAQALEDARAYQEAPNAVAAVQMWRERAGEGAG